MDDSNRITVARVRAALEKTGATLERGITWDGGRKCGCPMGVVGMAGGLIEPDWSGPWRAGLIRDLGLTIGYGMGLVAAFEGFDVGNPVPTEDGKLGHADGLAIVAELMPAGPPSVEGEAT